MAGEPRQEPGLIARSYQAVVGPPAPEASSGYNVAENEIVAVESKPLFRPSVVLPRLARFVVPSGIEDAWKKLRAWADLLASPLAERQTEQELLPDYLADVFYGVLGYTGPSSGAGRYTLSREKYVEADGEFVDAVLGEFGGGGDRYVVAVEGKRPSDPLERPHAGRRMSAVDQAYRYAINLPCDWLLVTNLREIRLYHKGSDQRTYERFEIGQLAAEEPALRRFIFLLGADRVVPPGGRCHFYELRAASERADLEVTKAFYAEYADMRREVLGVLRSNNPGVLPESVLFCTQKLLDRVLFCAFCEDRGLLPADSLRRAFEHRDPYNPKPVWENFKGLFRAIDLGNAELNIPGYNGGLFAPDAVLDAADRSRRGRSSLPASR